MAAHLTIHSFSYGCKCLRKVHLRAPTFLGTVVKGKKPLITQTHGNRNSFVGHQQTKKHFFPHSGMKTSFFIPRRELSVVNNVIFHPFVRKRNVLPLRENSV